MADVIELESSAGRPTVIRFKRPPVNALDQSLVEAITEAVRRSVSEPAKAIVLTGKGYCFSAGIDIKAAFGATPEQQVAGIHAINTLVDAIYSAPVPLVAAINGHALGGGLVIALACDVRVASTGEHKLALNEVAAGIGFPAGPLRCVAAELDPTVARDLCLTGRIVGPEEARALRVVDELRDPDELLERALQIAEQLASLPAYATVKTQMRSAVCKELRRIVTTGDDPLIGRWLAQ